MPFTIPNTFTNGTSPVDATTTNANNTAIANAINANDLTITPRIIQARAVSATGVTTQTASPTAFAIAGNVMVAIVLSGRNDIATPAGYTAYQTAFRLESPTRYGYLYYRTATGTNGDNCTATAGGSTDIGIVLFEFANTSTATPLYGYSNAWALVSAATIAATKATWVIYFNAADTVGPFGWITATAFPEGGVNYSIFMTPIQAAATYTCTDPTTGATQGVVFGVNHV